MLLDCFAFLAITKLTVGAVCLIHTCSQRALIGHFKTCGKTFASPALAQIGNAVCTSMDRLFFFFLIQRVTQYWQLVRELYDNYSIENNFSRLLRGTFAFSSGIPDWPYASYVYKSLF